ncbi:ABC transporter ATP-binding protein [Salinibacter ruber]|uniref:ABC transporter, multidrug efflux family n=1 Tax=Salinibacter ruber (strain DSM 13855 / M31) TaxID=309807 RepID=Q2S4Z0_SALRD|nr:ABC transporter ATP-binding protein [Salinibacter ruber]ABC44713.1 ABC transporter, multidrug efflux family [Salinibacter ruber DSM 13855]
MNGNVNILKAIFDILTRRERRNLYMLFGAVLLMAGLEVVSIGSIMPFLKVAADPASVHENVYLSWFYETFGFTDTNTFLIALGLGAFAVLVLSNAFIVLTTWALQRYAWGRNHSLSSRLLRSYLYRPYEYFLTRNSAELGKNILEEVKEVVSQMLIPGLRGIAKGIVALFIIGFLVFIDPFVALSVATILGLAYMGVYFAVRKRLDIYGEKRVKENTKRYQFVSEAFGGIKEVKLRSKEDAFLDQYNNPSKWYSRYQARYRVMKRAPRYVLEAIAFGGIILIAIYLIAVQENIRQVIPMLGLYAFAGYRLMPALQSAFKGIASARYNLAALEKLRMGLKETTASPPQVYSDVEKRQGQEPLTLDDHLALEGVHFTYPGAKEPAIQGLTLEIPAHSTVGFVGKTGSGKTTTVDLVLGLLRPQQGIISVDGTPIQNDTIRRWQQAIGYVPQDIYLSDDTVARNIAFGVSEDEIDLDAVRDAARKAHIYDFVEGELPDRWNTVVGERGVKLSGGQQQRIGIARALYHNPSVLVFDEATSALDQETEASVMEAIYELEENHTMLIIAHRLSTVKRADNIVMLEQGRKVGEGTYDELAEGHSKFRSMALS